MAKKPKAKNKPGEVANVQAGTCADCCALNRLILDKLESIRKALFLIPEVAAAARAKDAARKAAKESAAGADGVTAKEGGEK